MAAALLGRRAIPDHHLNKTLQAAICSLAWRPYHTTTNSDSPHPITKPPSTPTTHVHKTTSLLSTKQKQKKPKWEKSDQLDVDPQHLACLVHDILHSSRYKNGERLASGDEKMVVEKLFAYHPHSEDKIGCGIDYIYGSAFKLTSAAGVDVDYFFQLLNSNAVPVINQ